MAGHKGETSKAEQVKAKSVKSRAVTTESEKSKAVKGDGEQTKAVMSGFMVFRNEYVAKLGEKKKRMADESRSAGKAWRELPEAKKKEYNDKAMQGRPKRKMKKKEVSFHTRCSLGGFTSLVQFVNDNEQLKERVKRIGFGNLLKVQLDRLPRDLIVSMLRAYDPATHQFRIRGKTQEIEASHVHKLLGIPDLGEEVKVDVEDSDPTYQLLKREYGKKRYTDILKHIKSGSAGDKFEFMFVLYSLGTLLCPTSSGLISDRMLRVMCCSMDRFEHYDWATYMMKDLWKEMSDYVKEKREKKKSEGSCNVGGCLYLLLLFFAENFPLKQSVRQQSTAPIEFWTKEKINEMVKTERMSNMGILYKGKGAEVRAGNEDTDNVPYLDPVFVCGS